MLTPICTARHEERGLRGGGLDLLRVLERGLDIGCVIDRGDDDAAALLLARREVGADGLQSLGYVRAAFPRLFGQERTIYANSLLLVPRQP
jgi:hypothetical protein